MASGLMVTLSGDDRHRALLQACACEESCGRISHQSVPRRVEMLPDALICSAGFLCRITPPNTLISGHHEIAPAVAIGAKEVRTS